MLVTRNGSSVIVELEDTDFMESAVRLSSPLEIGHAYDAGGLTVDGASMNIEIKMSQAIYNYIGDIASGERIMNANGFSDDEARRISDEFLSDNLQIGSYDGEFDIEDSDITSILDTINIDYSVTFAGDFIAGAAYTLRAEIGIQKIHFYLIPNTLMVERGKDASAQTSYVDSSIIYIPSDSSDTQVSDTVVDKLVNAFKVATFDSTVTLGGRSKILNISPTLIGLVHRFGYAFGDVKDIYVDSVKPFEKFGFMTMFPDSGSSHLPPFVYGVVSSANAIAIVDIVNAEITQQGLEEQIRGTLPVKYIVGDIRWPSRIEFKEIPPAFDIIVDGSIEWEKFGPIRDNYIHGSGVPQAECIHSWEGRTSLGIKKLYKSTAKIED